MAHLAFLALAGSTALVAQAPTERPAPRPADGHSVYASYADMVAATDPVLPAARALTRGDPHWFSYYDVHEFDAEDRRVLGMRVGFEHREPTPRDVIELGYVDLQDNDRWVPFGETRAWNWQAGCRLQWRPGSKTEVMWNDRDGERWVIRVHDIATGETRTIPHHVYHVHQGGGFALTVDPARISACRGGYGYHGVREVRPDDKAPADDGVTRVDLATGESKLVIPIAKIAETYRDRYPPDRKCYFHCIGWNPSGTRFLLFMRHDGAVDAGTTVVTAAADGGDVRFLNGASSHYAWLDDERVSIWIGGAYRLFQDDGSGKSEVIFEAPNGHQTYLRGGEWLVTDTYPQGEARVQHLYLFHVPTKSFVPLGRFASPRDYKGSWRCDLHPRLSRDETKVVIDSPHGGSGRQLWLVDIGPILAAPPN